MRNMVEHGQIERVQRHDRQSRVLGAEPLHQVDLGADAERRARRGPVHRADDVVGRAHLVGQLDHLVAALRVDDDPPVRVPLRKAATCSGRNRWCTEQ